MVRRECSFIGQRSKEREREEKKEREQDRQAYREKSRCDHFPLLFASFVDMND
jgi:hypothetical protein